MTCRTSPNKAAACSPHYDLYHRTSTLKLFSRTLSWVSFVPPLYARGSELGARSDNFIMLANGQSHDSKDGRSVFFFDIDNCLYPKSYQIHDKMSVLIDAYFQRHLSISQEEAYELHQRYYRDYGLAIEGLVRHHKVDPMEYNRQVDDALPLDDVIRPNPELRKLIQSIDTSRFKLWLFTNAYITHGKRVVKLLGIDDLFEGITFCDYGAPKLLCKPSPDMFAKAMHEAGIDDVQSCYFVDDSGLNVKGAKAYGWKTAHLVEPSVKSPPQPLGDFEIRDLSELPTIFPEVFKTAS